jgi:hypothetical protein
MVTVAQTPTPSSRPVISQSITPPAHPQRRVDDALIEFPLAPGQEKYGSIDDKKMHTYVVDLAYIAKRYRDNGHPKYWAASSVLPPTMKPTNGWRPNSGPSA